MVFRYFGCRLCVCSYAWECDVQAPLWSTAFLMVPKRRLWECCLMGRGRNSAGQGADFYIRSVQVSFKQIIPPLFEGKNSKVEKIVPSSTTSAIFSVYYTPYDCLLNWFWQLISSWKVSAIWPPLPSSIEWLEKFNNVLTQNECWTTKQCCFKHSISPLSKRKSPRYLCFLSGLIKYHSKLYHQFPFPNFLAIFHAVFKLQTPTKINHSRKECPRTWINKIVFNPIVNDPVVSPSWLGATDRPTDRHGRLQPFIQRIPLTGQPVAPDIGALLIPVWQFTILTKL